jgi:PST family polysaccharide transporter
MLPKNKRKISSIFDFLTGNRFKEGYSRIAVKNSLYQFLTSFANRFGGLLLTIILARLLMRDLFGLYSLALGTILLFASLADFGFNQTLVKFISSELGKGNKRKAKAYFNYISRFKFLLLITVMIILVATSKFIALDYYEKPIFISLLIGALYVFSASLLNFFDSVFNAANNFKLPFYKEVLSQLVRLVIVPLFAVFAVKFVFSQDMIIVSVLLALSITYLFALAFSYYLAQKSISFLKAKPSLLTPNDKKAVNIFLKLLSVTFLSGLFFGYVDILLLGRLISAGFIGDYKAAFNLVGSISAIVAFPAVLFPIFSRLQGDRLERGFKKSRNYTLIISLVSAIVFLTFSSIIINIVYGPGYPNSLILFRILLILIIILPIISVYENYFFARNKPKLIAFYLILSTAAMVILSYLAITYLIQYGQLAAVIGVCLVAILVRLFYLGALIISHRLQKDIGKIANR